MAKTSARLSHPVRKGFVLIGAPRLAQSTCMRSAVAARLVSLAAFAAGGLHIRDSAHIFHADYHRLVTREACSYEQALVRSLQQVFSVVSLMGSMLQRQGKIQDIHALAHAMAVSYGLISILQPAPKSIVSDIYPLRGEEMRIGKKIGCVT